MSKRIVYRVQNGCTFCRECVALCPEGAITMDRRGAHIDEERCIGCGVCYSNCAAEAIVRVRLTSDQG